MVSEAVTNGICHGNKNNPVKKVMVDVNYEIESVKISVEDEGEGFDPNELPDALAPENLEKTHGRGIFLINCLGVNIKFNEKANRITFQKNYS
jgi:serine/threonine-protein kinase RsbW